MTVLLARAFGFCGKVKSVSAAERVTGLRLERSGAKLLADWQRIDASYFKIAAI